MVCIIPLTPFPQRPWPKLDKHEQIIFKVVLHQVFVSPCNPYGFFFIIEVNLSIFFIIDSLELIFSFQIHPINQAMIYWFPTITQVGSCEIPDTPDYTSQEAQEFLGYCLQADPKMRWSAEQLLEHTFVKVGGCSRSVLIQVDQFAQS